MVTELLSCVILGSLMIEEADIPKLSVLRFSTCAEDQEAFDVDPIKQTSERRPRNWSYPTTLSFLAYCPSVPYSVYAQQTSPVPQQSRCCLLPPRNAASQTLDTSISMLGIRWQCLQARRYSPSWK